MKQMMIAAVMALGMYSCSDTCAKQAECAQKSGATFSQTECQNDSKIEQEKAANSGCGGEYNELVSCVAALDCSQINDGVAILAECGAKYSSYAKCVN